MVQYTGVLTQYIYCEGKMKKDLKLQKMCAAALLCAIGILIPIFSPIKIRLEPMSFTLGSHVAIFIAMFISPSVAVTVTLGTTIGFLLGGFTPIVVLRAASQIVFVVVGAYILQKHPGIMNNYKKYIAFSIFLGIIHAAGEVLVCSIFFFSGAMAGAEFFKTIILLVGVGTLVHSIIDMSIAVMVYKPICKSTRLDANVKL